MYNVNINKKTVHYNSIDGLRALACLGIIAMHIQANTDYNIKGSFIFDKFIPSLTWLVYLFLMVSGFGMCSGYLRKFQDGSVDLESFYKRRYKKILPFFAFLLLIALIVERSLSTVYEASVELLMLHGLLPNNAVSVVGVCWTLGVIFLFYLLFPCFSVLMKNKKRAWISLLISLYIVFICNQYFFSNFFVTKSFTPRHSFLYCLPMFIGGGLVYLYRDNLGNFCRNNKILCLLFCIVVSCLWYLIPTSNSTLFYIGNLILFCSWLSYAVGLPNNKFLSSKIMKFLSSISMEMYLAQMVIFRVVEKMHMLYIFGNAGISGWISYLTSFALTVIGLIIFIYCYKLASGFIVGYRKKRLV